MIGWLNITLIATFSVIILVLLLLLFFIRLLRPKTRSQYITFQKGISMLHRMNNLDTKCSVCHRFRWADHPSLIADAIENGWSVFRFEISSDETETNMEISWEACEGSSDNYMQKVRLKRIITGLDSSNRALFVTRTSLPIPGPRFGNSFFPQQPYFEITIFCDELDINNDNKIELCENESILLTVGLTGGGHLSLKSPGCCPGSIGFNSSGCVYLNGTKLVFESEMNKWATTENVIGCGYNPRHNRVFFTLNSQLVHEIYCKTEEFGYPLFPTIATNIDVTFLLNLGQNPFQFEPANSRRTPNPCSVRPQKEEYSAIVFERSAELFSMGSMDSEWKHWPTITSISDINDDYMGVECDQESLTDDLFEIQLISTSGRSHS